MTNGSVLFNTDTSCLGFAFILETGYYFVAKFTLDMWSSSSASQMQGLQACTTMFGFRHNFLKRWFVAGHSWLCCPVICCYTLNQTRAVRGLLGAPLIVRVSWKLCHREGVLAGGFQGSCRLEAALPSECSAWHSADWQDLQVQVPQTLAGAAHFL